MGPPLFGAASHPCRILQDLARKKLKEKNRRLRPAKFKMGLDRPKGLKRWRRLRPFACITVSIMSFITAHARVDEQFLTEQVREYINRESAVAATEDAAVAADASSTALEEGAEEIASILIRKRPGKRISLKSYGLIRKSLVYAEVHENCGTNLDGNHLKSYLNGGQYEYLSEQIFSCFLLFFPELADTFHALLYPGPWHTLRRKRHLKTPRKRRNSKTASRPNSNRNRIIINLRMRKDFLRRSMLSLGLGLMPRRALGTGNGHRFLICVVPHGLRLRPATELASGQSVRN